NKMPADIVTTEQLRNILDITNNMDRNSRRWVENASWYPKMQDSHYGRIAQIYLESRLRYGDYHFLRYGHRRRLAKKFLVTAEEVEDLLGGRKTLELEEGVGGSTWPSVPPTTNGEYGRVKPSRLHMC
ncbi:hypothetical protein KR009_008178, partial [Drosophila setifemur]